ncbi:MAG: TfuA-like protein [Jatrophihabitans sp.]
MDSLVRPTTGAVLYVGPSLPGADRSALHGPFEVRPPIRRGDLPAAVAAGVGLVGIVDGEFYQRLAVSPKEILAALQAGCQVIGGASMGALRAAELWPHGMSGAGQIYAWFRGGQVTRDDDVAVSYSHDEDDYRLLTVPWVNVKWLMQVAGAEGWLGTPERRRVGQAARAIHWEVRTWSQVCRRARLTEAQTRTVLRQAADPNHDRKRLDALGTVEAVRAAAQRQRASTVMPGTGAS